MTKKRIRRLKVRSNFRPTPCPRSNHTRCLDQDFESDSPSSHLLTPKEIAAIERTSVRHFHAWLDSLVSTPATRDNDDGHNESARPIANRGLDDAEDQDEDESPLHSRVYDAVDEDITIWRIKCRVRYNTFIREQQH